MEQERRDITSVPPGSRAGVISETPGEPRRALRQRASVIGVRQITAADRHRLIAEAAYLRAERRGFAPGGEVADWLAAEAEVDAMLAAGESPA
jgi:hypothetical protein